MSWKDAREGNVTLDARLNKIESGTITIVNDKQGLPDQPVVNAIYAVLVDESHCEYANVVYLRV